jgi:DNA mismatch endonuclease (patch repair protein)
MTDVFTREKRSAIMSRIKGENTKPEILVRKIVHSLGYRFRLHSNALLGKPDLVLPRHEKIIFVHGCFWHGHNRCSRSALPSTNKRFWQNKILVNKARDIRVRRKLSRDGWKVVVIWQCQTKDIGRLTKRLKRFLEE